MEKKSWTCTLIIQLSLCLALFLIFQIGLNNKPLVRKSSEREPLDLYFISVRGGLRTLQEQTHLLKQVEKMIKTFKVKFVINISELGQDDPLNKNATQYFQYLDVPWYATKSSNEEGANYFVGQANIPSGSTLDVVFMDTGLLQGVSNSSATDQLNWLERTLKASNANWRIVAGYHSLVPCDYITNETDPLWLLHQTLLKFGVNAHISGQACSGSSCKSDKTDVTCSTAKRPYFTALNQRTNFDNVISLQRESAYEFLLHRVSSLEMVTYYVSLAGEVMHKIPIRQLGRAAM